MQRALVCIRPSIDCNVGDDFAVVADDDEDGDVASDVVYGDTGSAEAVAPVPPCK